MQKIIILDLGSETTQVIGRRVRELDTFCEVLPYNKYPEDDTDDISVVLRVFIVWHDLAESIQLAHAATDELGGLRTKIKNDDFLHFNLLLFVIQVFLAKLVRLVMLGYCPRV